MKPWLNNGPIYPTTCSSQPDSTPVSYPTHFSLSLFTLPPSTQLTDPQPWTLTPHLQSINKPCLVHLQKRLQVHHLLLSPTQISIHPHRDQCEQPPPMSWLLPHPSAVRSPPAARARPLKLSRSLPGLFKSPSSPGPRRRCRTCYLPSPAHFLLLEDLGWVPSRHILLPAAP